MAGRRLAYVGNGGNVAHSLLEAAALAGMDVAVATPDGLEPHPEVVARALAAQHGARVQLTLDPAGAVRDAAAPTCCACWCATTRRSAARSLTRCWCKRCGSTR